MDTTGCPPGRATDFCFLREAPFCESNLTAFWGVSMWVSSMRAIAAFAKTFHYVSAEGFVLFNKRIISVLVSCWSALLYFIMSISIATNLASAKNGLSFSLLSITYCAFIVDFTMVLFKIVRLGKRVVGLPQHDMIRGADYLQKFSALGMFMVLVQILMAIVASVTLIIMSPIFPEQDFLFGTIGFATKGVFQIFCTFGIVFQFQRCVQAINHFIERMSTAKSSPDSDTAILRMKYARKVLKQRQMFLLFFGGVVSVIFLLMAADVIPWTWEAIIFGIALPEALGTMLVELVFRCRRKGGGKTSSALAGHADAPFSSNITHTEADPMSNPEDRIGKIRVPRKKQKKPWKVILSKIQEESRAPVSVSQPEVVTSQLGTTKEENY